jgi:hypothetical protein
MLAANLIGMGLGPIIAGASNDYIFRSDAALNKSIALCGVVVIPIAALIVIAGLGAVRKAVTDARQWEGASSA